MTTEEMTLESIDITDVDLYHSRGYPWREWDMLRREAPIYWYERPNHRPFWAVTRHEDIGRISRNSEVFVSTQRLRVYPEPQDSAIVQSRLHEAETVGMIESAPLNFIDMDEPEHSHYRSLINRFFTPRAMDRQIPMISRVADERVSILEGKLNDARTSGAEVEFTHTVAVHVPAIVTFELLGVAEDLWDELMESVDYQVRTNDDEEDFSRPRFSMEASRVAQLMQEALDRREAAGAGTDCLLDVILRAEVGGERVSPRQRLAIANLLLFAGLETTRNALAGGVHTLLKHPDQLQRLIDNPDLIDTATEEILRWISPVIHFTRTAVADFDLNGTHIRAGEDVTMFYPSANRDERVFTAPYTFDIGRDPNSHLAFGGYGTHFCLGANLARWEIRATLRRMLPLLPRLELAGEAVWHGGLHVGGFDYLPIRLRD